MIRTEINTDINFKEIHYPIYFDRKNICVSCGAEGDLQFVNIFGKNVNHEVHPFEYIKCSRCHAVYSIKWTRNPDDGKLYPSAVDKNIGREFVNLFKKKADKQQTLD